MPAGCTVLDVEPVTVPTPLSTLSAVAFETFHDSVLDCPSVIDAGLALNELIVGTGRDCVVAWTLPDCADEFPAASVALTVYVYVVKAVSPVSLHVVIPPAVAAN